ncbi:MAG: ECF transporter S component [Clostridia bacterium]|nr:ECF transporter S component [Clostridia bacterium]
MQSRRYLRHLVTSAMFAALIYISTCFVQIPNPASGGYVHPGDALCLLAAWLLPLPWGIAASAIGTMLADLLSGYAAYALPSFIIKAIVPFVAGLLLRALWRGELTLKRTLIPCLISGVAGEIFMVGGYFLLNAVIWGNGWSAAVSILPDTMQALFGIVVATVLFCPLKRILLQMKT